MSTSSFVNEVICFFLWFIFFQVVEIFIVLFTELVPLCLTTCHSSSCCLGTIFASLFLNSIHFSLHHIPEKANKQTRKSTKIILTTPPSPPTPQRKDSFITELPSSWLMLLCVSNTARMVKIYRVGTARHNFQLNKLKELRHSEEMHESN